MRIVDRRRPTIDESKLSTQRLVTYILLLVFTAIAAVVFNDRDQAERSTVLQTVINFTMIAVGFWLGSSKTGDDAIAKMRAPQPPPPPDFPKGLLQADEVNIDANKATVTSAAPVAQPEKGQEL